MTPTIGRRPIMQALGAIGLAGALSGSASANTAQDGSPAQIAGPISASRFLVEIDGIATSGFSGVGLPPAAIQESEYREGNNPPQNQKLWGQSEYDDLTLERGVRPDEPALYEWFKKAQQGKVEEARKNIAVNILNSTGEQVVRYEFTEAWPKEYSPPSLDAYATGRENVATEELTIAYEQFERTQ